MSLRDALGNVLNENDFVSYPLGPNSIAVGQIVHIDSGLDQLNPQQRPTPVVLIQIQIPLPANPAGVVGGILKVATEKLEKPKSVVSE